MPLSTPAGYSAGDLVFEETFATLGATWHTYITSNAADGWPWNDDGSGGSGMGADNNDEYMRPSQVAVSDGKLSLTAIHQSVAGWANGSPHTFPFTSGAVSTYANFEFNGGYLQVSMKAASGNGAWSGIWLMPGEGSGNSGDNFEIDIQESGFTEAVGDPDNNFSWHMFGPSGWVGDTINTANDLTADYHTYAIEWVPGESITWFLDGVQMAQVTSASVVIPDQPMHLMISQSVASANTSGWHTVNDGSTPFSMQMLVDGVQYYSKGADDMADNVTLPGVGEVIAAKEVAGAKSQRTQMQFGGPGVVTDVSDTNPLPTLSLGSIVFPSTDVTLPTGASYSAGNAISNSASSPTSGGFTFTNAVRANDGFGRIEEMLVCSSNDPATRLAGEIFIFNQAVTNINNASAFAVSDAEIKNCLGVIPFSLFDAGNNGFAYIPGLNLVFNCVGTRNLRFLLRARNGYTWATSEVLTFTPKIVQLT